MLKVIALLALTVIAIGIQLGNFWFTFGLWPRSWAAFVFFAIATLLVAEAVRAVIKSDD